MSTPATYANNPSNSSTDSIIAESVELYFEFLKFIGGVFLMCKLFYALARARLLSAGQSLPRLLRSLPAEIKAGQGERTQENATVFVASISHLE